MNKKKLVISLLVFILILSLALTALVGCKPKPQPDDTNPVPDGYREMNTSFESALKNALDNTTGEHRVNNLEANAQLDLSVKYGESTSALSVKFGANVVLDPNSNTASSFGFSITDKSANANIVTVWYQEGKKATSDDKSDTGTGDVYVDLGNGENQKNFVINGLNIKSVMKNHNVNVSDKESDKINEDVTTAVGSVFGILDMVSGLGSVYQAVDNSHILFSISLAQIFEDAGTLLDGLKAIDEYAGKMNIALASSDLKTLLPALTIDLKINMEDAGEDYFDDAVFTGIDATIGVAKKDLVVKRTDGTNFVRINIAQDSEIGLGLDFAFGAGASKGMPRPLKSSDWTAYKKINAINFKAEGQLELKQAIGIDIKIGEDSDPIPLKIPAGTYNLELAADLNPVKLIGKNFSANSLHGVLDLVGDIATDVIKKLSIKVTDINDPNNKIDVSIEDGAINIGSLSLIGKFGEVIGDMITDGMPLTGDGSVMALLKSIIKDKEFDNNTSSGNASGNNQSGNNQSGNASGNGSGSTESGDPAWIKTVGDIVKNLTIEVNDGKAMVELKNQSVAKNHKYLYTGTDENKEPVMENGKHKYEDLGDTILDVKAEATKNGLVINADVKNIVLDQKLYNKDAQTNLSAKIEVNNNGITITAKSENFVIGGIGELPIDLVIKLTKFEIGGCK